MTCKIFVLLGLLCFLVSSEEIVATIATEKIDFLFGEPVYLKISSNIKQSKLEYGHLKLACESPSGNQKIYRAPLKYDSYLTYLDTFATVYSSIIIDNIGLFFDEEGTYSLRLMDTNGRCVSNWLQIRMQSPSTPEDLLAWSIIEQSKNSYGAYVYIEGCEEFFDGHVICKQLADFESRYQTYAKFALSGNASIPFLSKEKGRARAAIPNEMEKHAQLTDNTSEYIRVANAIKIARFLERQDKTLDLLTKSRILAKIQRVVESNNRPDFDDAINLKNKYSSLKGN